jgi:hypothetical protein
MKPNTEILEKRFRSLKLSNRHDDRRNAAEHAYALSIIFKNQGNMRKARQFAKVSIDLFDENQGKNPGDYAPRTSLSAVSRCRARTFTAVSSKIA